jgi:5-methylcytosine-specific restriction endonuclease McrA
MEFVFVVDTEKRPLSPCHPARARRLLTAGKAAVWRRYPFAIILKGAVPDAQPDPLRLTIDPGSKTTGLALLSDRTGQVARAGEVTHRGQRIRDTRRGRRGRRAVRRGRRQRHTRYRPQRFDNRQRADGWLPPSLESRVRNVLTWVDCLRRYAPVAAISQEVVQFDTQALQHPEMSGVEYQQGELAGYKVREYRLEKFGRQCAYCGATGVPRQVEHIVPKARGGTNRVSTLTLACQSCNDAKGTRTAEAFGHPEVQAQAKRPLKDAAAVNASRWALYQRLLGTGLPVEVGTGGRTKWNRTQRGLPKAHWLDAACVGASTPEHLACAVIVPLLIAAAGRHSRQMCRTNAYGFPDKAPKATSVVAPSITAGTYMGRLAVRATGSCNIKTSTGIVQGIHIRYCRPLHRGDGYTDTCTYSYQKGGALLPARA